MHALRTSRPRPSGQRLSSRFARSAAAERLEARRLLSGYLVTTFADSGLGSLRDAFQSANANPGPDTITFASNKSGTITLTVGQLEISDDLTIDGPGAGLWAVSGNKTSRVFQIDQNAHVTIDGLTITAGHASDGTPGKPGYVNNNKPSFPGTPGGVGADGGAIYNLGSVTLSNDAILNNSAGKGGDGGAGATIERGVGAGGIGGNGGNGGAIFS